MCAKPAWVENQPRVQLTRLPTPIHPLDRLSAHLGHGRIWIKRDDLTGTTVTGNKLRKLEFVLARALDDGCDTIITVGNVQSNHCSATALAGAQLGFKTHLILKGEPLYPPEANLLVDYLAGATVSFVTREKYVACEKRIISRWMKHYEDLGRRPYFIPTGASDEVGIWGYIWAAFELAEDFARSGIRPNHIIVPVGSAGTMAGLLIGAKLAGLSAQVWGISICDSAATLTQKLRSILSAWDASHPGRLDVPGIEINVVDDHVGQGYAKCEAPVLDFIRFAATTEALMLDPVYTGKALYGLTEEIRGGTFKTSDTMVFIHTGGLLGLLACRKELFPPVLAAPTQTHCDAAYG